MIVIIIVIIIIIIIIEIIICTHIFCHFCRKPVGFL